MQLGLFSETIAPHRMALSGLSLPDGRSSTCEGFDLLGYRKVETTKFRLEGWRCAPQPLSQKQISGKEQHHDRLYPWVEVS